MADLNSFSFTGRLTKDARLTTLASGKQLLVADVAVNTGYGDYKKTLYLKVQQWGASGANVAPYLTKGKLVTATGELSRNEWTTQDGKTYVDFIVDVRSIQMLSAGGNDNAKASKAKEEEFHDADTDDIVF